MNPDWGAGPNGNAQCRLPCGGYATSVDGSLQSIDSGTGWSVPFFKRFAAVGRRAARGIYSMEGRDELCQPRCQRAGIGDVAERWILTVQPAVDGPGPGVAMCWFALPERLGNRQR